jgi:hypothetical protein
MQMLSEDDLDIRAMSRDELDAAWDLWFELAQSTNDVDPAYAHGVFADTGSPTGLGSTSSPLAADALAWESRVCAGLLAKLMSQLSEDYWCAGWLTDIEYDLWAALEGRGSLRLREADVDQLRYLAGKCAGWISWDDTHHRPRYVPADEWRLLFDSWSVESR